MYLQTAIGHCELVSTKYTIHTLLWFIRTWRMLAKGSLFSFLTVFFQRNTIRYLGNRIQMKSRGVVCLTALPLVPFMKLSCRWRIWRSELVMRGREEGRWTSRKLRMVLHSQTSIAIFTFMWGICMLAMNKFYERRQTGSQSRKGCVSCHTVNIVLILLPCPLTSGNLCGLLNFPQIVFNLSMQNKEEIYVCSMFNIY